VKKTKRKTRELGTKKRDYRLKNKTRVEVLTEMKKGQKKDTKEEEGGKSSPQY